MTNVQSQECFKIILIIKSRFLRRCKQKQAFTPAITLFAHPYSAMITRVTPSNSRCDANTHDK